MVESPGASVAITPCSDGGGTSTFVCGLNSTDCLSDTNTWTMSGGNSLVLRPAQIAMVQPILQSTTSRTPSLVTRDQTAISCPAASTAANATALYTSGQMAGLGCGLGLPLGFALLVSLYLLRKEREKHAGPKLMYKLPDNHDDFTLRVPSNLRTNSNLSLGSHTAGDPYSNPSSRRNSIGTTGSGKPIHLQTFAQRYEMMKNDPGRQRHELDGAPPYPPEVHWHELDAKRMSR